jgi:hypothetical protein
MTTHVDIDALLSGAPGVMSPLRSLLLAFARSASLRYAKTHSLLRWTTQDPKGHFGLLGVYLFWRARRDAARNPQPSDSK